MSKREDIEKKTEELILPILDELEFELFDIEYVKEGQDYYLRAYIDKDGGITIDDCVAVSRKMNELLDEHDFIKEQYIFEVSSPGLGRPLKKDNDFDRSIGKRIEVHTFAKINGCKEFEGELISHDKNSFTINNDSEEITFDKKNVSLVRLAFDF
ncbi:MAG TPA: ribosome maturation factor RimP [Lachnospiraceae bacterium]|nr:ribosome maturation factor RimP [Lachnospiraceae bacterium]